MKLQQCFDRKRAKLFPFPPPLALLTEIAIHTAQSKCFTEGKTKQLTIASFLAYLQELSLFPSAGPHQAKVVWRLAYRQCILKSAWTISAWLHINAHNLPSSKPFVYIEQYLIQTNCEPYFSVDELCNKTKCSKMQYETETLFWSRCKDYTTML